MKKRIYLLHIVIIISFMTACSKSEMKVNTEKLNAVEKDEKVSRDNLEQKSFVADKKDTVGEQTEDAVIEKPLLPEEPSEDKVLQVTDDEDIGYNYDTYEDLILDDDRYSDLEFIISGDYTYCIPDKEKKEILITKVKNVKGEVTIPGELDGFKVIGLGLPFSNFSTYEEGGYAPEEQYLVFDEKEITEITGIILPEGIKLIGIYAFQNMKELRRVSLPESLEIIGICAFDDCGINEIVLPSNIKLLDSNAFYGCHSLSEVTVNCANVQSDDEDPPFNFCDNIEEVRWGDIKQLNLDIFRLSNIKKMIIPATATKVDVSTCNIETLVLEGKDTSFSVNMNHFKNYKNDNFKVIVPEGAVSLYTIKRNHIKYEEVPSSQDEETK